MTPEQKAEGEKFLIDLKALCEKYQVDITPIINIVPRPSKVAEDETEAKEAESVEAEKV